MDAIEAGTVILHYRITEKIGAGGMGQVYKADDLKLGRPVAIKVLPPGKSQDHLATQRLVREARSASALNHPNIVTIHAVEEAEDFIFIVMELVQGESLRAMLRKHGPVPLPKLLNIALQTAEALALAHSSGIVHRDIKPDNILITPEGRVKLLDFGLAKSVQSARDMKTSDSTRSGELTAAGTVAGTMEYMSPEQVRGEVLDARSDIFSLGSTLYEAAAGVRPFKGFTVLAMMNEVLSINPPLPSVLQPGIPVDFDLLIERALAKDKQHRYGSMADLAAALRSLAGLPAEDSARASAQRSQPIVGRETEIERLNGYLRQSLRSSGKLIFLTGEPGIGKTALVGEFLARARQQHPFMVSARGRCVEQYGTGEAYLPFLEALSNLFESSDRDRLVPLVRAHAPTWCLQIPAALASSGITEQMRQDTIGAGKDRMLREMGDLLSALSATSPHVLVLEDLHWADPSTVDLVRHLSQRIAEQKLLIVGTFRPEDLELGNHPLKKCKLEMQTHKQCEEIALGPLAQDHIRRYLDLHFAPNNFPVDLPALIERKTEGHPLFATSLIEFLAERGDICKSNSHWSLTRQLSAMDLEAPENVLSMIRKKIDALAEDDRRVLQYASICGDEFHSVIVAKLLDMDELALEEQLATLSRTHRLIQEDAEEELPDGTLTSRYRFVHALYQNLLYAGLVNKRRVMLHRQTGEQLAAHYGKQSGRISTRLAMHFERGRDFSRAVEYLGKAGDNAGALYAYAEAEEHYTRALALQEKGAADAGTDIRFHLCMKRGSARQALGHFEEATKDFELALNCARELNDALRESQALNAMSTALFYWHRVEEMEARCQEALAAAGRTGNVAARLESMLLMALSRLCYGQLEEAKLMLDEIIATPSTTGNNSLLANGLAWRAILHFFQTEYQAAETLYQRAVVLASDLRDGFLLMHCYFAMGLVRGNLGRISDALETLHKGIEIARRNGDGFWFPRLPNCIGWLHREIQDFDGALKHDRWGADVGRTQNVLEAEANSLINIGIDQLRSGDHENTLGIFQQVEDIFSRDAWFRWRYNIRLQAALCEQHLVQADLEQARHYAGKLLHEATQYQAHKYIGQAHALSARIAMAADDFGSAEREVNTALDELRRFPAPVTEWKIHALAGRLQSKLGNSDAARASYETAAGIVKQIASNVREDHLREIFMRSAAAREVLEGARTAL